MAARATYWLGWIFFAVSAIDHLLLRRSGVAQAMFEKGIWPHHLLQLSGMFFLISIASAVCGRKE